MRIEKSLALLSMLFILGSASQASMISLHTDSNYGVSAGCGSDPQSNRTVMNYVQNSLSIAGSASTSGTSENDGAAGCAGESFNASAGYSVNMLNNYYSGNAYNLNEPEGVGATASAGSYIAYTDSITLQPGTYEMIMTMTEDKTGSCASVHSSFGVGGLGSATILNYDDDPCIGDPATVGLTQTVTFTLNNVLSNVLDGYFQVTAPGYNAVSSSMDATMLIQLFGISDGASYSTGSGIDYTADSSAPEPRSGALILSGIAAILLSRRRRIGTFLAARPV